MSVSGHVPTHTERSHLSVVIRTKGQTPKTHGASASHDAMLKTHTRICEQLLLIDAVISLLTPRDSDLAQATVTD
eukprot:15342689-Alexandrium_andersonii.AAC.1